MLVSSPILPKRVPVHIVYSVYIHTLAQKHRGFAFVTYTSSGDAQDAIDNMDLNVLSGRVLRVSLAKPQRMTAAASGNRASTYLTCHYTSYIYTLSNLLVPFSLGIRRLAQAICETTRTKRRYWCSSNQTGVWLSGAGRTKRR